MRIRPRDWGLHSFGSKFFFVSAMTVVIAGTLSLIVTLTVGIFHSQGTTITASKIDTAIHNTAPQLATSWNQPSTWSAIFSTMRQRAKLQPVRVSVVDITGRILYQEGDLLNQFGLKRLTQTQLIELLAGKSHTVNDWLYVVAPIQREHETLGIVIADLKKASTYRKSTTPISPLTLFLIPTIDTVLVSLLASLYLARRLRRRLAALTTAIRAMAEGDYRSRLPLDTADEIGQVAAEFNYMADKLEESRLQEESIHTLKRELITNVSHDLRGPLTSIQGYVEALEDGLAKDPDTIRRYAGTIRKKSTQLSQLVDDLLLYSRLESGHIPLSTVQEDAADWFRQSLAEVEPDIARAGLTLEADIPNSSGIVTIDVHKMQQVVANLVQNTLRYALGGGRLTAGLETIDNSVRFMLADDGPGLQTADIPHLFERFYQGRNQAEGVGAGLGLAIAAQLVNAHGGQIWAENKSDGGAAFYFSLPLASSNAEQMPHQT